MSDGAEPVLRTSGLCKEFGGFQAVGNVNLEVRAGDVHVLVGPNGAGKTTLFNLLTGFLTPTRGTIAVAGQEVAGLPPERIARLGVARSFQIARLFDSLTLRAHLELALAARTGLGYRFLRSDKALRRFRQRTEELLSEVGLADRSEDLAGALPYGQKRALELALALASDPKVLLLDEPTAGMGVEDLARTVELIGRIKEGRTVVMVEHNMKVVADLADRVTVLQAGSILVEGSYEVVRRDPRVVSAYGGLGLREDPPDRPGRRGVPPGRGRRLHPGLSAVTAFLEQIFNVLVSGSFYALLALGLSVIFGMLGVVNFAHGACYMLGAFGSWLLSDKAGLGFWPALLLMPLILGVFGMALERTAIRRLSALDPLYNFLLTFGLTLALQDLMVRWYGVGSQPYSPPTALHGTVSLGLFDYPRYPAFVLLVSVVVCAGVWLLFTHTRVGMVVRAATERPEVADALGIDVNRWITPVFGFGIALAGLSGVLAAPMRTVNPLMGSDLVIIVFAVVVIGGLGSVFGSVAAGFGLGLIEALGELYAPFIAQVLVFLVMAAVLLWRPAGLFGRQEAMV